MGLFDIFKKKKPEPAAAPQPKKVATKKSEKELATERGEPYVAILSMDVEPANLHMGAVELDWNDKFIMQLTRHGYTGKTDAEMVDQWFTNVCRHIVLESFEQEMADPEKRQERFAPGGDSRFVRNQKIDDDKREYR